VDYLHEHSASGVARHGRKASGVDPQMADSTTKQMQVAARHVGVDLSDAVDLGARVAVANKLPALWRLTPRALDLLKRAGKLADEAGDTHIGVEHLFLSLIDDDGGVAVDTLNDIAARERARDALLKRIGTKTAPPR